MYPCTYFQKIRGSGEFGHEIYAATDSKLCAKHFTPDQFFTSHPALAKKCGYKKLDLRPDAIPTLFDIPIEKVEEKKTRKPTFFFKRRIHMSAHTKRRMRRVNSLQISYICYFFLFKCKLL